MLLGYFGRFVCTGSKEEQAPVNVDEVSVKEGAERVDGGFEPRPPVWWMVSTPEGRVGVQSIILIVVVIRSQLNI